MANFMPKAMFQIGEFVRFMRVRKDDGGEVEDGMLTGKIENTRISGGAWEYLIKREPPHKLDYKFCFRREDEIQRGGLSG